MDYYKITKEQILSAKTYMPEGFRVELAEIIANKCLVDLKDRGIADFEELISLPSIKGENLSLKNVMLTHILLTFYLGEKIDDKTFLEKYDYYSEGHIFNQLERFKSNPELKEIVFDILADFKEFKKYVDTKIYDLKVLNNDPTNRLLKAITLITMNPDFIKNAGKELKKFIENVKEIQPKDIKESKEDE